MKCNAIKGLKSLRMITRILINGNDGVNITAIERN